MVTTDICLCGIHVHKGTLICAIICLIGNVIVVGSSLAQLISGKKDEHIGNTTGTSYDKLFEVYNKYSNAYPLVNLLVALIVTVFVILLIYGNRTRKPEFYRPFLVAMIIDLALAFLIVIGSVVAAIVAFVSPSTFGVKSEEGAVFGVVYLIVAVIVGIIYLLHFYFYYVVVNRSRNLLLEEQQALSSRLNPNTFDKQPVA